jgi:N-acetylmuramoyl-L-alanine amidase
MVIGQEDVFVDLQERVKAINSLHPHLLISLHLGTSPNKGKRGANAFVSSNNIDVATSKKFAENILQNLNGSTAGIIEKDLFVLKIVNCPAVTVEVGHLSNDQDRELLSSEAGQRQLGKKILDAIISK